MTARKTLPAIAPCPRPGCEKFRSTKGCFYVVCACGWVGPCRKTARAAIVAWNRRASDAGAERRGAMASVEWLRRRCSETMTAAPCFPDVILERAIECGEVLRAKASKDGTR